MTGDDNAFGVPDDEDPDAGAIDLGGTLEALLGDPTVWAQPPDGLADGIVAAVRSESVIGPPASGRTARSWVRPALLGAAAVVLFLFGGVVVLSAISGSPGSDRFSADLVATGLVDDVGGSIEVTSFDSGLRIDLDAPSLPRRDGGRFYEAWVRTADGLLVPVGTFHGGDAVSLWAGIERDRVVAFTITLEEAVAPDSADQTTSGQVVLKADLP